MKKITNAALNEAIREEYIQKLQKLLEADDQVLRVKSNQLAIPVVDSQGAEKWMTITVAVKLDKDYDGYFEADCYAEDTLNQPQSST